jgi:hypothetical protein
VYAGAVHLARMPKVAFPSNDNRSKGILDLVHSDVCGVWTDVNSIFEWLLVLYNRH